MSAHWIGVASQDHVQAAVEGGFCQFGHGKSAPHLRLSPVDGIVYYSPRERLKAGDPIQAFTALGRIRPGQPYQVETEGGFTPYRRDVDYLNIRPAPIKPLLSRLAFTRDHPSWGYLFRRGFFAVSTEDYHLIAGEMGAPMH